MTVRIAGWSGPRNISTAMMRSWDSRPDCVVVDEPFYACYLLESGADHPMRDDIIASQPGTRGGVVDALSAQSSVALQYEKHMTHHMPRGVDLSWTRDLKHVFLIRSPERVIASYRQKMPSVSVEDIGIIRQRELFDEITVITGKRPPVVDSLDILNDPARRIVQYVQAVNDWWTLPSDHGDLIKQFALPNNANVLHRHGRHLLPIRGNDSLGRANQKHMLQITGPR